MKKRILAASAALALLLSGCGRNAGSAASSSATSSGEPARAETLNLEFAPAGGDAAAVLAELGRVPEKLKAALAERGVEVGSVQVTMGTSLSATGAALAEGGVDAAFLPTALSLAQFGGDAEPLLTRGYPDVSCTSADPADWNGTENATTYTDALSAGRRFLLCAGPSAYGKTLAGLVNGGKSLSWAELDHARWGVTGDADALASLWLADGYEGNTLDDLSQVTDYESYDAAMRALAAGEADVILLPADLRIDWAEQWTLSTGRTAENGGSGLDRAEPVWEEVNVIGITEPLYAATAAVAADSLWAQEPLASALREALSALSSDEDLAALGAVGPFVALDANAMAPVRRLATLEG